MKVFCVLLFISCIAVAMCESDEDEAFDEIVDACASEIGISADAWDHLGEEDMDPKSPDFLFCIYKKLNFLNEDGEYQIDAIREGLSMAYSEEVADKYIEACTTETYGSGPETALQMAMCEEGIIPDRK